jgi:hypothetical protein
VAVWTQVFSLNSRLIYQGPTDEEQMEITAPLNSTALPSRLSAEQFSGGSVANRSLKYKVYDKNKIAVTVVDKKSGDIIREIPPEVVQKLSVKMDETIGKFFDQVA